MQTSFRLTFSILVLGAVGYQLSLHLGAGHSAVNFLSYFTNLSNLLAGMVFLAGAARNVRGQPPSRTFNAIRTAATLNMIVVGVVFALLLRNVDLGDLRPWVNVIVHYVMPLAVTVEYLCWPPRGRAATKQLIVLLLFPTAYVAYVLIRGAATGWYPYPFLNPAIVGGYTGVAPYVAGIFALFVIMAWLFTKLSARIAASR